MSCGPSQEQLNVFASCLSEKGAVMYGASWCPHCTEQKEMFGEAFVKINYIECTDNEQTCADENIQYLPTWKFADKSTRTELQQFSDLAEKTGCLLK